jgi:hypothetical protein
VAAAHISSAAKMATNNMAIRTRDWLELEDDVT